MRALFGGMARLRRDRALHPDGVVLHATFSATAGGPTTGGGLLDGGGEHRALVRLSRGASVPEPLPDVLGCALRVVDAYGPGRHQDLALASSRPEPVARHALVPARNFLRVFYSSVLPYRIGGQTWMLGARVEAPAAGDRLADLASTPGLSVTLVAASPLGAWEPIARVRAERVAAEAEARRLRFNPWNTGDGIRPAGWFNALRDPAYRASQEGSAARV